MVNYEQNTSNKNLLDYKNADALQEFITNQGKILSRRRTKLTAKQHRKISKTIKKARILGFLSFMNKR
jgi:small subunit ribosomal protein S18